MAGLEDMLVMCLGPCPAGVNCWASNGFPAPARAP